MMYSVIIPVYRNEEFVPLIVSEFTEIAEKMQKRFGVITEFVFVVDASPDESYIKLEKALSTASFRSQLILHTRNFGSFAAVRTGLRAARGDYFAIAAADLQEPPELLFQFYEKLCDGSDIVVGVREGRADPALTRISANVFWRLYRLLVFPDIPTGGVDVFACNRRIRDELLKLEEANSSLIGLVYWLGFTRSEVSYSRRARVHGESAWTFNKKLTYLLDSIFAFTDLPIRFLTAIGLISLLVAIVLAFAVIALRLLGKIQVEGYTMTILVITFFGSLNTLGLGLIGAYAWRSYENTKRRPLALVSTYRTFGD